MTIAARAEEFKRAVETLDLAGTAVCVHSSMRSFGHVDGGPKTVVDALLARGCTIMTPAFSWHTFALPPPASMRPVRNGFDYSSIPDDIHNDRVFHPSCTDIDAADLGAIPTYLVQHRDRVRSNHPLSSFVAVGPLADRLVPSLETRNPFEPLRNLTELGGNVLLAGVGLHRLTLLHLAECDAGRRPFLRWARNADGHPNMVEVGGCSEGFPALETALAPFTRTTTVGAGRWCAMDAGIVRTTAATAMVSQPAITHCDDANCRRCDDSIAGGPRLAP